MRYESGVTAFVVTALCLGAISCAAPDAEPDETDEATAPAVAEPQQIPTFEVDASWPTLPNDWILGQVASVTVDERDHVWVLHRPRTVEEGEEANAAPPVLEFDVDGAFINAWGGPTADFDWPENEHGIHADDQGHIWVGGNGGDPESDDMLLKLTNTGELLLQIGGRGVSGGNTDTNNLRRPAESFVYAETNEVFVADGYGNRRVIVLDADTGAFKRMWGAFGSEPMDLTSETPADGEQGPQQFATVHGIEVANDGLVYVADRNNSRLQVFTLDGTYSTQGFVNRNADSALTVAGVAFSPDPQQQFLYIADQGNSLVHVVDRQTLEVLDSFGSTGEEPGAFQALHHIASDSQGNIYTAEAQRGRRAQKFRFTGMVPRD
jgi:DNA-binding beta-propeller fold protein YncE